MSKNIEEDNLIVIEAVKRLDIADIKNILAESGLDFEITGSQTGTQPFDSINIEMTFDAAQFKDKLMELLCD